MFLISASLLPSTGVSTVTANALYPAFSALRTRSRVTLRSCVVEVCVVRRYGDVWIMMKRMTKDKTKRKKTLTVLRRKIHS